MITLDEAIERRATDTVYRLKGCASTRALVWATGAKLGRDEADEARRLSRIIERDKRKAHFMQTIRGANMGSK